jgi:hypothetical protein
MAVPFATPHAAGNLGSGDEPCGGSWGVTAG